jgi:hypothetical protein
VDAKGSEWKANEWKANELNANKQKARTAWEKTKGIYFHA